MLNKDIKDIEFTDLLELQSQLDEVIIKPRYNGFIPREITLFDIRLALDDEFQEWLRELPNEYNFKVWKEKEYNRENELIELVDVLFIFLKLFNFKNDEYANDNMGYWFDSFREDFELLDLPKTVLYFKEGLWSDDLAETDFYVSFVRWIEICRLRGFTKEEVIQAYIKKWKYNIGERPNGDWSLGGNK